MSGYDPVVAATALDKLAVHRRVNDRISETTLPANAARIARKTTKAELSHLVAAFLAASTADSAIAEIWNYQLSAAIGAEAAIDNILGGDLA